MHDCLFDNLRGCRVLKMDEDGLFISLNHDIACLSSKGARTSEKIVSLKRIRNLVSERAGVTHANILESEPPSGHCVLLKLFARKQKLRESLFRSISDEIESCRTIGLEILAALVDQIRDGATRDSAALPHSLLEECLWAVVATLCTRVETYPPAEDCEELRKHSLQTLNKTLETLSADPANNAAGEGMEEKVILEQPRCQDSPDDRKMLQCAEHVLRAAAAACRDSFGGCRLEAASLCEILTRFSRKSFVDLTQVSLLADLCASLVEGGRHNQWKLRLHAGS
eukprot:GHVU01021109.1.p1 GENE.GHVU01021109.1~~GHVU01021109.1.p1  ORF type:complete len:283 (-),score=21.06 GHVU01021109.1:1355-2203(-)